MKYQVLDKIFNIPSAPRKFEYLEIDCNFNILDISDKVQRFADCSHYVMPGKDVRVSFPELIGVEDILTNILEGEEDLFEIKGIKRSSQDASTLYIDIYIIGLQKENQDLNRIIILIEDVTQRMVVEQKLAQKLNEATVLSSALAGSKDYIDKIINSIADALIVTTKTGKIKKVNRATEELFGYSEAELLHQHISLIITDDKFLQAANQQHPLFTKYLNNVEVVCKNKNKEKLLLSFSRSIIQSKIKEDFVYIGRDITERQRSQKRQIAQYEITRILSESKSLKQAIPQILEKICENLGWDVGELWTPDKYLGINAQGHSSNPVLRCVEIWSKPSISIREFEAITWQTTLTPGIGLPGLIWATSSSYWMSDVLQDANFTRSQPAAKAGLHSAFGFPILNDGQLLGVMTFSSREVQTPDEDLLEMMVAIGRQIVQFIKHKRAEEALLESEERYRDLFENAHDLIQCVDGKGNFVYVNRAWRKTLGYSEAETANMNVLDIIHPEFQKRYRQIWYRAMMGEKLEQVKAAFITKKGEKIFVEGNIDCKFVNKRPVATRGIFRNISQRVVAEEALHYQQRQTESLLQNILPIRIANRLKQQAGNIAENYADVTVMFADIVGFTQLASCLRPIELVSLLNQIFSTFDRLSEQYGLEKIKTIGDAYMVVGGLPTAPREDHAQAIAQMALDMQKAITQFNTENNQALNIRIGIHSGAVVAGVIGIKKFSYDLWGDTVNIASRMESQGLAGQIQVTEVVYERLREEYLFEKRGEIEVKGKGRMTTYLLSGHK